MNPLTALIGSLAASTYTIVDDARHAGSVTAATWIPTLWLAFASSRSLDYWLTPELLYLQPTAEYTGGSGADRLFLLTLMALALLVLAFRPRETSRVLSDSSYIIALFIFMAISIVWSDVRGLAAKRLIRGIGDLLMIMVLATEPDPKQSSISSLRRVFAVMIPLSLVFIKYYRELGLFYTYDGATMWMGVTTHKNSLGQLAAVSTIMFLWCITTRQDQRRIRLAIDTVLLLISLWLLKGSPSAVSKTSLIVTFLGAGLMMSLQIPSRETEFIRARTLLSIVGTAVLLAVVGGLVGTLTGQSFLTAALEATGRDMTLTGRTDLWAELVSMGGQRPVLGSGYNSFWIEENLAPLWSTFQWKPESAHNGFIDVFLSFGLVGLVLLLLVVYRNLKRCARMVWRDRHHGSLFLSMVVMITMFNITESSLTKPTVLPWLLFLMVYFAAGRSASSDSTDQVKSRTDDVLVSVKLMGKRGSHGS